MPLYVGGFCVYWYVVIYVAVILPLGLFVFLFVLVGWLKKLREEVLQETRERIEGQIEQEDPSANCFGREQQGKWQVRGNGCLAMSERELYFRMWKPRREIRIPRDRITKVYPVRSHLGKSKGVKLLKVELTDDQGRSDSVAWAVRDLDTWLNRLGATLE